ncbi:short-chain dehydrogenase/reductase family protein [Exidia glandulosa HHB12029]|uniref:Short-chain dehydrogenase/reductase family protein n=1 Tax=Exidia glandulosa HHB12029 TaxID=1314781 RepID=A0A165FUE2_EXIGL|nr:short-chain dehydrogenase/reductase family protein [Exidia glandulosa HHB12029]
MSQSTSRVVFITGCSVGSLGAALAERFAAEGCRVFATARNVSKMEGLSVGIEKIQLDVLSDASVKEAVNTVVTKAGRVDILVNGAGVNRIGALMDLSLEEVEALFQTNVFALMRVVKATQAIVPHMVERKSGLIINLGSIAGNNATPWYGAYSASKAALHSYTDTLDMELRPFGIKVLLLALGMVHSNITANNIAKHVAPPVDSLYSQWRANIDARLGQGNDVMSAEGFAKKTVAAALSSSPPNYMSFGGQANAAWLVSFIPRAKRLSLMWKLYSAKEPRV